MRKVLYFLAICLCFIAVAHCAAGATDTPTDKPNDPTITPTQTPTANPTQTPTDSPAGPTDTPTSSPTSNPTNATGCLANTDCASCSKELKCVWCGETCMDGFFFGPKNLTECKDFRWQQCKVNGRFAFIGVLAAIGLFLFLILICVCKCCCCQKKRKSKATKLSEFKNKKAEKERLLDDEEAQVSSTPVTDQRRAQMREKWGIKDRSVN